MKLYLSSGLDNIILIVRSAYQSTDNGNLPRTIMVKSVIKRDGRIVEFDKKKIIDAVTKAMDVTDEGEDIVLAAEIAAAIAKSARKA